MPQYARRCGDSHTGDGILRVLPKLHWSCFYTATRERACFRRRDRPGGEADSHGGTTDGASGDTAVGGIASEPPADRHEQPEAQAATRKAENIRWRVLEMPPARPHRTQLHSEPPITTGKLATPGARGREPEGEPIKAHTNVYVCVSPTTLTGGYRLSGAVNGAQMSLLLDTGAAVTLLREDTWVRATAKDPQELQPRSTLKLVSADGTPLTIHGCACVELELEGAKKFTTEVVVVSPLTSEAILGLDFLKRHRARIDLENKQLHLTDCTLPLHELEPVTAVKRKVRAERTAEVPPFSVMEVFAYLKEPVEESTMWLLEETTEKRAPAAVARALVQPVGTRVPVRLLNPRAEPRMVYAGTELATLEEVEARVESVCAVSGGGPATVSEEKREMLWKLVEESDPELSGEEKELFLHLLLSYADVFAVSTTDLGRTDKLQHAINTGDSPPTRQPVRRIPPHRRDEVRKILDAMLEKKVVEPSKSPWSSPIVLVQKKDGTTRFCADYRKLNNVTRKDAYPLPRIDTTLDTLAGSKWFSTLDLLSGYWQVELEEGARQKTAFCTTEGLFQFRVMPFGLCNAPATFQRLMDLVLAGLQWSHCLVYLDDVVVLGRSFDEHLRNLESVFRRLREAGLRLKPSKCSLFRRKVQYLGHIISREGVAADPSKIEKVATWPTPTSVRETQQFLGFAGYYRRFVQDFAHIARPLHRLTERLATFMWTDECQGSFDELRRVLTSAPVLAYPDFNRQFILDTDASDTGIGAVLSQVDEGGRERVIAYGSRLLTKPERRYCVTRRELLAVVTFAKQYRPYLTGQRFLLRTDHGSLIWLRNFREPEGQLARWLERLQELDFDIVHRRGKKHTNADALSRLPCRQCGRESHNSEIQGTISTTSMQPPESKPVPELRKAQLADPILGPLLRGQESGKKPSADELGSLSRSSRRLLQIWDQLTVRNGVLCRRFETSEGTSAVTQTIIPEALREEVLTDLHEGALGGHLGIDKTLARLKTRFYWPGHYNDVCDWCQKCGICAARKSPAPKAHAPLTSIKVGYPMQLVAMDIVGPFPESPAGNTHILVVADYFTRWTEAYPIPNQEATTVASKLTDEFFFRFSPPEQLHSDQGRNFESDVIAEVCRLLGVTKTRTTPYHPQSDGLVERFNRTLLDMLATAAREQPFDWENQLRRLCLAYNTSVNPTTGKTPFFLMFGRQVRMPIDIMYGNPTPQPSTVPQYVADLRAQLETAYQHVRERMGRKLERQKELYDRKAHGDPYKPGDLVWLHNPAVPRGQAKKLHRPWTGPFRIVRKLSDAVYRVQHTQARRKRLVVHFDRLKPCPPDVRIPDAVTRTRSRTMTPPPTPPIGTNLELLDWDPPETPPRRYPRRERSAPDRYQAGVLY